MRIFEEWKATFYGRIYSRSREKFQTLQFKNTERFPPVSPLDFNALIFKLLKVCRSMQLNIIKVTKMYDRV